MKHLILLILICTCALFAACTDNSENSDPTNTEETDSTLEIAEVKEPTIQYNFVLDSFIVDKGTVQPDQGLTHILPKYGISLADIYYIAEKFDSIFDVKKIKSNHSFTILSHFEDTLKVADHFIYEINKIDYLVYTFGDSLFAKIESKDVRIDTLVAGGIIKSSLWNAFIEQGVSPALVSKVTDLYAWSIDFFDVKPGDYYKVIYDAKYVEGEFVGVGEVHAVLFNHRNKDYYFFQYENDSNAVNYYTEKGEQMQKALLSAPLEFKRVSSKFSNRRFHPVLKIYRPHHGVDYAAATGTEVVATGSGTVIHARRSGGAGHMVKIQHDVGDILTKYLHLSKYGPGIKKGVHVSQGQKIGEVGSTGTSTGPHLDYRIYINGKAVDPLGIDIPTVDPLKDSTLIKFNNYMTPVKARLDQIETFEAVSDTIIMEQQDSLEFIDHEIE